MFVAFKVAGAVVRCGVTRWFVFKPKIAILVKFGGPWNGKCCYVL
jgi:hypothetical protein